MSWKKFLLWFKDKKPQPINKHLDNHLIKRLSNRHWPSLAQFAYLPRFLNQQEKKVISILIGIAALAALSWLIILVIVHHDIAPKDGGEYSEAIIGQPKLINPIFASVNDVDADLVSLIYSGLFRYDQDGQLTGDLATNFELSPDKKIYEIHLRQDVLWSDNKPFTANDVIYTFETILNPEIGSPLLPSFQGITVKKNDEFTVTFTLKEPFSSFLHSLTVGIIPEHIWGDFAPNSIKLAKNNLQPTGTGPWQFNKLIKDDSGRIQNFSLTRNNNYYGKKPYLNIITFKFFDDEGQTAEALRQGDVLGISFVSKNIREKIGNHDITLYEAKMPQYTALFFNMADPTNKNNDLRLALAKAIDKNILLREGLDNEGEVIDSPILKNHPGYNPNGGKITLDVAGASALLDKNWVHIQPEEYFKLRQQEIYNERTSEIDEIKKTASTTPEIASSTLSQIAQQIETSVRNEMHLDQPFYRKDKNGEILSVAITTANTTEYNKTAEAVAKMWRMIGAQTNIITITPRQISREALRNRNYQIILYGEIIGSDPDLFPFWHSSQVNFPGLNLSCFADRTADKLLEDARSNNDPASQGEYYKKFQDILDKELPAIFLYTPSYYFGVDKQIKGVNIGEISSPAERYSNLSNWYIKTKWIWKK